MPENGSTLEEAMLSPVDDITATVEELKSNGVVFEDYDLPSLKTVGSIADRGDMKVAWFKDSEGNMLGMAQPVDESVRAAMGPPPLAASRHSSTVMSER